MSNDKPKTQSTYLLFTEVAQPDGTRATVQIGTAKQSSGSRVEWQFSFEQVPLSGEVWARVECASREVIGAD